MFIQPGFKKKKVLDQVELIHHVRRYHRKQRPSKSPSYLITNQKRLKKLIHPLSNINKQKTSVAK